MISTDENITFDNKEEKKEDLVDEQTLQLRKILKTLLVRREIVGPEAPQAQQKLVCVCDFISHCTRGESALGSSIPSTSACPASNFMY